MMDRTHTLLLVVDFQDALLPRILNADRILAESAKMIRCADVLEVPVIFTEQYPKGLGKTTAEIAAEIRDRPVFEKTAFGCFGDGRLAAHVAQTGRRQLLMVGIETHVCVMQTALQGIAQGYEVFVARDAVSSRTESDCTAGLARMAAEGARIVTVEMAVFELLRAAGTPEFKRMLPLIK